MSNYSSEIENGIKNGIIEPENIYDFLGMPLEDIISGYYFFCRDNLDIQAQKINIAPNSFLFTNSFSVNATAILKNKHYAILINMGLIKFCNDNYLENDNLHNYFATLYPEIVTKFDTPINMLAYQVSTQFTYYHELAHLFQYTKKNEDNRVQERNDNEKSNAYNETKHIIEINADIYASLAIETHVQQFIERIFGNDVTIEITHITMVIVCCIILNYVLSFSSKPEEVYIFEHTHPHAFIRLFNSILNIVQHFSNSPYFTERKIVINSSELFSDVMETYKNLEAVKVFKTDINRIIENNKTLDQSIISHLHNLIQFNTTEYQDAMTIWNKK